MKMRKLILGASGMALLFSLGHSVSYAQEEIGSDERKFEPVIVTATKRAEDVQDVPISVTVFGEARIEEIRPDDLNDLAQFVPNLFIPPALESANQAISIRGLGGGVTRSSARAVGLYIDGVYSSAATLSNLPVSDFASVEVLRGPQGTLFGRDTIGGAVNITTQAPSDTFGGFAEAEVGNFGRTVFTGGVDIPISDTLSARISGRKFDEDGYIDNAFTGDTANGSDQFSARAQLFYTPNEKFDARLVYTYLDRDDALSTGENIGGTFADDIPYLVNVDVKENFQQESNALSLNMNYTFDSGHTLTSVTGYSNTDDVSRVDRDLTPESISQQSIRFEVEDFNQEFRLTSPDSETFDYLLGVYYFKNDTVNDDIYPQFGAEWAANLPFPLPGYPPLVDMVDGQTRDFSTEAIAAFVHANYYFNDKISVFGGVRFTNDQKEISLDVYGELFSAFGFVAPTEPVETDDSEVSWTLGARYAFSEELTTYGTIATGFRSSAVKDDFVTAGDIALGDGYVADPEFVTNYEIGAKYRGSNNGLALNVALFQMNYEDFQVQVPDDVLTFVLSLENAEEATIRGIELDGEYQATENFRISGSLGYLDTEYTDFSGQPELEGEAFPLSPEWTASLAADFVYPLAGGDEILFHLDATELTDANTGAGRQFVSAEGYSTINSFAAYQSRNNWRLTLWAKNLADSDTITRRGIWGAGLGENEHLVAIYQPPRTYGATLRYEF